MTKKTNGIEATHKAAESDLMYAASRLGVLKSRTGLDNEPFNYFTGLIGEVVYLGGHRFSLVAKIERVEITDSGEAVAIIVDAIQIDDDRDTGITGAHLVGDGFRMPESCIGFGVQPLSGTSKSYQDSYHTHLAQLKTPQE